MSDNYRQQVFNWLEAEHSEYASHKYTQATIQRKQLIRDLEKSPALEGEWGVFILNYWGRVKIFGLNTYSGRQALGKLIVTLIHCLETAIEVHGPMPEPGVPSGEIITDGGTSEL